MGAKVFNALNTLMPTAQDSARQNNAGFIFIFMCYSPPYIHRMAKNKEMTPTMRARICELHSIGWGYRKIHTRYPQIPVSTIRYTILNENDRDDHASKPRSGRPPVLSPEQKDLLHRLVTENPHIVNCKRLLVLRLRNTLYAVFFANMPLSPGKKGKKIATMMDDTLEAELDISLNNNSYYSHLH